jgi:hypothetical protein
VYRPVLAAASIPAILALVFLVQSDSPAPNVDAQDSANVHLYQAGTGFTAAGQDDVTRFSDSIKMGIEGDTRGSGSHGRCGCN